jgi:hypothetical protein
MSRKGVRWPTLMWIGVGLGWVVAASVVVTWAVSDEDLHPTPVLLLALLLVLVTGVASIVYWQVKAAGQRGEVLAELRAIRAGQPPVGEVAAEAALAVHNRIAADAQLRRIGDSRR